MFDGFFRDDVIKIPLTFYYSKRMLNDGLSFSVVGRYTHKIAITKHRIISVSDKDVSFRYKDYSYGDKQKVMTLSREEFLLRFELHFLPSHFTKIRHYGFLQNNGKRKRLEHIRALLQLSPLRPVIKIPVQQRILEKYGKDITLCPC